MSNQILTILAVTMMQGIAGLALASPSDVPHRVTEIIDAEGDGAGDTLDTGCAAAENSSGNACPEIERRTA